ncbi:transglycosylase domain-containing protein [Entomospira culicis]|uniref:peptidoglycan glycosyltransferase n=1 Tax=Entomospira culicis TaxID=2719989 RepID=A0A968KW01_9SPIO|nr:transglycosylase domain-containing protein [Entomospira culicis]NIZ19397.1 penicillin-binding protein [Entomospira culicis]NIZ69698.1 penicillin-binding protein [Entomospira culicis]WDI36808.1 transglycosylase domain-containing protein [Entomospira culicis]WDI38437.1 transglycosylase domain-containing protein [Entomospira culicis]
MAQKQNPFYLTTLLLFGSLTLGIAVMLGILMGLNYTRSLAVEARGNVGQIYLSTPSVVYAHDGQVVTEFFGNERRELITYQDLPITTIHASLIREDKDFFDHRGYSITGTVRAAINTVMAKLFGFGRMTGGSTLTQQLSGHIYADRGDISISRKVKELWWAMQIERHLTKQEILETYMNKMPFGHTNYGIQAASRYFFGHGIQEADAAQSVALVIQLSAPSGRFSPLKYPDALIPRQEDVLSRMVERNFLTQEEAERQMQDFWQNHDWSRDGSSTAFFERIDLAPYFSEHIRSESMNYLTGRRNIYTDGYKIYTTVHLDHQQAAEEELNAGLERATNILNTHRASYYNASAPNVPSIEGLALFFNMPRLRVEGGRAYRESMDYITQNMIGDLDIATSIFGIRRANNVAINTYNKERSRRNAGRIETALITVEQESGYITALIGGSGFSRSNQLNRATQAKVMPGSSFKPLYYAEAIASGNLTAATRLDNYPKTWINEDGTYYRPENYNLDYNDGTRLRMALAQSLNIPAITVLERVGIDAAIARAARLLGIQDPMEIGRTFPRVWSLGLGIISTSPMQMVRAFAVFPNQGEEVIPISIKRILDRNDQVVVDVEAEVRATQNRSNDRQILSPQAAFIMTDIMRTSVTNGTLYWAHRNNATALNQPIAGKTGTTQNWSDAWAIAFTPYYTTAVWYGFDKGGYTLSIRNEASSSAAPVLMRYMLRIHEGLPRRDFIRPGGISEIAITADGHRWTPQAELYGFSSIREYFITGTGPEESFDDIADDLGTKNETISDSILEAIRGGEEQTTEEEDWLGLGVSNDFELGNSDEENFLDGVS